VDVAAGPWSRALFSLHSGRTLVFNDIRKFGRIEWSKELPARLLELGPEPLEIDVASFGARLRARSSQIKALLLNQEFLRGLGNIYCDESLFRAGIHPRTLSSKISKQRAQRLHTAIQAVLADAIEQGGSSISDYVDSEGSKGYFQLHTAVYGKTGQPCKVCGHAIKKIVVAARSTHYCSRCQRR
jgi:formamidopyrimidine-DNA glycosylase